MIEILMSLYRYLREDAVSTIWIRLNYPRINLQDTIPRVSLVVSAAMSLPHGDPGNWSCDLATDKLAARCGVCSWLVSLPNRKTYRLSANCRSPLEDFTGNIGLTSELPAWLAHKTYEYFSDWLTYMGFNRLCTHFHPIAPPSSTVRKTAQRNSLEVNPFPLPSKERKKTLHSTTSTTGEFLCFYSAELWYVQLL